MRAFETVMAFGLSVALGPPPSYGLSNAVKDTPFFPEVVPLKPEELASVFGGQQTQSGVMTTIENAQEYLDGIAVAAALNEGAASAGWLSLGAVTIGSAGAVIGAYGITQQLWNDVTVPLAVDIYNVLSYHDPGRLTTTPWSVSDLVYRSDLVIESETTAWIDDWYCQGLDCMCDNSSQCESPYVCQSGYCTGS